jgi:DNA-binding MarR family transcriptional regulator
MDFYTDSFSGINAPSAIEINIRPNILYTEEYSYLTKDELEVLFLLATTDMFTDGLSSFSFSGIKRQLGKHQQKITKAVNRLLSKNLICKNTLGYSISSKGTAILSEVIKLQNAVDLQQSADDYLQQRITFNEKIPLDDITTLLVGKWFGSFRYISHTEGKDLVIRWQLVDSRASAILHVFDDEAILNIIPDKQDSQKFSYEQALDDLSRYFFEILSSLGINAIIEFEGWRRRSFSEIDFQQRFTTWLSSLNNLSEN